MRFWIAGLTLLLALWGPGGAQAAMGVEVRGAVGVWCPGFEGEVRFHEAGLSTGENVDLDQSCRLYFWLSLDHPVPFLPGIKLGYADLEGRGDLWARVWGEPGPAEADLSARIIDLTLFWHVPMLRSASQDRVDITYGLNARWLETELTMRERLFNLADARRTSDEMDLMLYVGARLWPLEWLCLEAEARGITLGDHDWRDFKAGVQLYPWDNWFLGLGYRDLMVDEHWNDTDLDLSAQGWYGEVGFSF